MQKLSCAFSHLFAFLMLISHELAVSNTVKVLDHSDCRREVEGVTDRGLTALNVLRGLQRCTEVFRDVSSKISYSKWSSKC